MTDIQTANTENVLLVARKQLPKELRDELDQAIQHLIASTERRVYSDLLTWLESEDFAIYEILGYSNEYVEGMKRGKRILTRRIRVKSYKPKQP